MRILVEDNNNENPEDIIRRLYSDPNGGIEAVRRYMSGRFNINEIVFAQLIEDCSNEIKKLIDNSDIDQNKKERSKTQSVEKFNSLVNKSLNENKNISIEERKNNIISIKNKILKKIYETFYGNLDINDVKDRFDVDLNSENINEDTLKEHLYDLYLDVFKGDINNTNIAVERVMNSLKKKYKGGRYERIFSNKNIIEKIFNKCIKEVEEFKAKIEELKNDNMLMESEDKKFSLNDLNKAFAQGSLKGVDTFLSNNKRFQDVGDNKVIGNGDVENTRTETNGLDDVKSRIEAFNQRDITNDTLTYIYNMDISKYNNIEKNYLNNTIEKIQKIVKENNNKQLPSDEQEKIKKEIKKIIGNSIIEINGKKKNFLDILNKDDWKKLYNTLNPSIASSDFSSKDSKAKAKKIVDIVKKITFDTNVPVDVKRFRRKLKDSLVGKVLGGTYKIYYWGNRRLNIFDEYIKRKYIERVSNENKKILNNIDINDIYRSIKEKEFWKNVCVISCYKKETYSKISSLIYQISRDDVDMTSSGTIEAGLSTQTSLFMICAKNDDDKLLDRDGKKIIEEDDKDIEGLYKEIERSINRYYFILLTEGYFHVGGLLNKGIDAIKKIGKLKSDSSFLGLSGKGDRAY